jgi:hypothetical protein
MSRAVRRCIFTQCQQGRRISYLTQVDWRGLPISDAPRLEHVFHDFIELVVFLVLLHARRLLHARGESAGPSHL